MGMFEHESWFRKKTKWTSESTESTCVEMYEYMHWNLKPVT